MYRNLNTYQDWELAEIAKQLSGELHFAVQNDWHREAQRVARQLRKLNKLIEKRRNNLLRKWAW